jgi:alkanesulfonate monooxygenase SsuD/methylene tetrahydromethanopterin reductase-like flavin-dependent oxidoreductase (luciferase family)
MWTAEHHFQQHGFEVVPNVLLLNAVLAQHTRRIRLGALIHVLTTWHPLHFAEDYALADMLAGGRLLCGLGRGTEERESHVFGVNVGYHDAADHHNRDVFEEQVAIFKAATANEQFAYRGTYYTIPSPSCRWCHGRSTPRCASTSRLAAKRRCTMPPASVMWACSPTIPGSGWSPGGAATAR